MTSNYLQPPDNLRNVRAFAVAKLKRAASLPRMKDGRRPPMHGETVSEGERATPSPGPTPTATDEERDPTNPPESAANVHDDNDDDDDRMFADSSSPDDHATTLPAPHLHSGGGTSGTTFVPPMDSTDGATRDDDPHLDYHFPERRPPEPESVLAPEEEPEESAQSRTTTPTTPQRRKKRRSRSRSRSRSKDLKEIMSSQSRPDSPDDPATAAAAPPPPVPISPFLVSAPSPKISFTPPRSHLPPQSPFFSQSPASPSALPSLDAIRAGLIRSNSAAGRMMAFHKLTGGKESPEPMRLSPSPSPSPTPLLARSNTVTGGERIAARNAMMRRLGERIKESDGEPAISEEQSVVAPTRRRPIPPDLVSSGSPSWNPQQLKRSPPASLNTNGIVDDREVSETSPSSPVVRALVMSQNESATSTPMPDMPNQRYRADTLTSTASSGFDYRQQETDSSRITSQAPFEYDTAEVRDGVVIERDEPDGSPSHMRVFKPRSRFPASPSPFGPRDSRLKSRPSDTTSASSSTLTAEPIPVFMQAQGEESPYKQDTFPVTISPFGTPNKESIIAESEEEGETVVYPEEMKARKAWLERLESESKVNMPWNTQPPNIGSSSSKPTWKQQIHSADDDDDDDVPLAKMQARSPPSAFNSRLLDSRGMASPYPSNLVSSDLGASSSPDTSTSAASLSPAYGHQQPAPTPSVRTSRASESASLASSSMRAPSAGAQNKSPEAQEPLTDWEDVHTDKDRDLPTPPDPTKEKVAKKGDSAWQKVRAFARSGSAMGMGGAGRRSRSNSFVNGKREDSSRESGASASSAMNLALPMNPAASSSMLSLSPNAVPPPRGGVSPVPPASAADLARYADQKLNPFPGLAKLQEEKLQRDRSESVMASHALHVPDTPERGAALERKPSNSRKAGSPSVQGASREEGPSLSRGNSQRAATTTEQPMSPGKVQGSSSSALPTSREGVRKWLNLNTKKWLSPSQDGQNNHASVEIVPPGTAMKPPERKPSLSELFAQGNRMSDSVTEKEGSSATNAAPAPPPLKSAAQIFTTTPILEGASDPFAGPPLRGESMVQEDPNKHGARSPSPSESPPLATPSSANTFPSMSPGPSMAEQSPNPSTMHSFASSQLARESASRLEERRTANIVSKLDTILEHASRDPARKSALDSPPRKLLLMSKAFQVLDRNTIKDRYLFLFTDILVIAKPMDEETQKAPLDHLFAVKSIVELTKLEFDAFRDGDGPSTTGADFNKHPSVKIFVQQFTEDPDWALRSFLEKMKLKDDPMTVANLLFRTADLDKGLLGQYLSRRSHKNILRAFVDRFGFAGVRIDNALRAFLLSIRLPSDATLLEHLLVTFAYRWFEANVGSVAFDKEVAARLVFAMMQLNDALHSDLDTDMTPAGGVFSFPNRNISPRDFVDAFRVWDRRMLVSDDVLEKIYRSIQVEKLAQALDSSTAPILATISPAIIHSRLTTRMLSETITIKIPSPDPHFGIHLQGQDLLFEPPFLSFAQSAEMSFKVIGNSLGTKTAIFARTGANASLYSGIPFSKTFYVERPFMRHTFRVAFTNHVGLARKYLFSVDSESDHANWTTMLERQIAKCRNEPVMVPLGPVSVKVRRAAEAIALRVLRDALIVPDEVGKGENANGTKNVATKGPSHPTSPGFANGSAHLTTEGNGASEGPGGSSRGSIKNGHDVLLVCQQNSLIPLVLSFLNVVKPI